jgi:hypothetical protein
MKLICMGVNPDGGMLLLIDITIYPQMAFDEESIAPHQDPLEPFWAGYDTFMPPIGKVFYGRLEHGLLVAA